MKTCFILYSPTKVKHHLTCFNSIFSNNELISNRFAVFVTCTCNSVFFPEDKLFLFVIFKLCTNKNHSYKHNEQINSQNIGNSECFGVKFVKIYPEKDFTIIF